ncbi:MAG: hypothetical protein ACXAEU_03985 [Candidatus Hodarchaeales archaeon]|jgi:hypothetical protein
MTPETNRDDVKMLIEKIEHVDSHVDNLVSQMRELKNIVKELKKEVMSLTSLPSSGSRARTDLLTSQLVSDNGFSHVDDGTNLSPLDSMDFIQLPRHLRDIYQELLKVGKESFADETVERFYKLPKRFQNIYLALLRAGKEEVADRIASNFLGLKKHLQETYIALINSRREGSFDELVDFFPDLPESLQETYRSLLRTKKETEGKEIFDHFSKLPKLMQEKYLPLFIAGKGATADDVALLTTRKRPVESDYLNQLHNMNLVLKYRRGKKVYFTLNWIDPVDLPGIQ